MNIKELIEDVISDLSNDASLQRIMLKAKTIAFHLENNDFYNWIEMECNGYEDIKALPKYRKIKCNVRANIEFPFKGMSLRNQIVPVDAIEDETVKELLSKMYIKESIFEIEELSKNGDANNLRMNAPAYTFPKVNELYPAGNIYDLWLCINASSTISIIMSAKSRLLEFFLQLNKQMDMDIDFDVIKNKKDVTKIIHQTVMAGVVHTGEGNVTISDSTVVGGKDNLVTISSDTKQQLNNIVSQIEALAQEVDDDRTDIAEAIIAVKEELKEDSIRTTPLKLAFNAIKGAISGLADTGIEKLAEQAIKLLQ